jgi:LysR family transcriptional activator of mexEF-oprN operon
MQLVVVRVQFHTVEEMLLSGKIDMAASVADELPRSIQRRKIGPRGAARHHYVCLYDPRFAKLARPLTERSYFAQEHVAVSYAGDARGIVEDAVGKARTVRVSVPAFSYVPDLVDGSNLVATVSEIYAKHVMRTRPHLRALRLPFEIERSELELLWSRVTENDAASRFVRELVAEVAQTMSTGRERGGGAPRLATSPANTRRTNGRSMHRRGPRAVPSST